MDSKKIFFPCYECECHFFSFNAMRSHVLFTHGHIVEDCRVAVKRSDEECDKNRYIRRQLTQKKYYERNRDRVITYVRMWRKKNKERVKA